MSEKQPRRPRLFTLAEANRAVPYVARIVDDLIEKGGEYRRLRRRHRELEGLKAAVDEVDRLELRLNVMMAEIERHAHELEAVGCVLKDVERGLVDFLAQRGEETICLCWIKGETAIGWWHSMGAGFGGRRPIAELPPETLGA